MEQHAQRFNRFKDAPWFEATKEVPLIVGGAGGIGSWLTLMAARAGFVPTVYDFDSLEEHNLGGQLFSRDMIGRSKVEALTELVKQFADTDIVPLEERFTVEDGMYATIMLSGFDNMKARKDFFTVWKNANHGVAEAIYIDGSVTAEQLTIYSIRGNDLKAIEQYEKEFLCFTDTDIEDTVCTFRQTSHSAAMIASNMIGILTNHITNVAKGITVTRVPFKWEYFIPLSLNTQSDVS